MEAAKESEGGLDERLRNLILSNASDSRATGVDNVLPGAGTPGIGPHDPSTAQEAARDVGDKTSPAAPIGKRKRLNQAQRQQMSTQLSIPIDTRPRPLASPRSRASTPGHSHQQHLPGGQCGTQRPNSATFGPPNPPLTAVPLPSQAQHHQSSSNNGPVRTSKDRHDWRHPQPNSPEKTPNFGYGLPYGPKNPRGGNPAPHHPNRQYHVRPEDLDVQVSLLENLCSTIVADAEIETRDIAEKEAFRLKIEAICREAISRYERDQNGRFDFDPRSVQLRCFGSLSSGFATKASDMDLGLVSPLSHFQPDAPGSSIPRIVEKAFLDQGLGARLLTRTRVPIIKLCERPPEHLMQDLLDERLKWEKGLPEDLDVDEETPNVSAPRPVDEAHLADTKSQGHNPKGPDACQGSSGTYEQKLATLRQSKEQSLAAYFHAAKGVLRDLGGRDITHSTVAGFTPKDYKLLNDVSLAFVHGLSDADLKKRLVSYRSLSSYIITSQPDSTSQPNNRSLLGVYTQAVGEELVMRWFSRPVPEKDSHREQQAHGWVCLWLDLQNKACFGLDPLAYNKELHLAYEQLKKISSIQILLLQQSQYESATAYHNRALRLLLDLGHHNPSTTNNVRAVVIRQYVLGIYDDCIRKQVEEFVDSEGVDTLGVIARRHKSLQLAQEFDKAVKGGLYDESSKPDIEAYTALLRGPMVWGTSNMQSELVVPTTPPITRLIARLRQLVSPSTLGPNQPRDPYQDRLKIPKNGVGVQCDINFSAHLALQNTLLLRCYSHTDPRVRPLILFVKHWAKLRGINSPYRGTLSSYGYVLMMLHYLVNIAQPFVCPNLQLLAGPADPRLNPQQLGETVVCKGRNVQFWRDEIMIQHIARNGMLTQNRDSVGHLLRGFFEYYAQSNAMTTVQCRGFDWGRDVLSLRSPGGLLSKQDKGWTGAKTVVEVDTIAAPPGSVSAPSPSDPHLKPAMDTARPLGHAPPEQIRSPTVPTAMPSQTAREVKEIRHRYLFAIEDPFELDHNVARTVTHNGIVSIRDEFRRAWRLIRTANKRGFREELLQDTAAMALDTERTEFSYLLDELHGRRGPSQA